MIFSQLVQSLTEQKISNPHQEALLILEKIKPLSQAQILTDNFKLSLRQINKLNKIVSQRAKLPLAYIFKTKDFYNLNFYVNQQVLIPRFESENLVDLALDLKLNFNQIYDIGCGSGILSISYFKNTNSLQSAIDFIDISKPALKIAKKNCRKYDLNNAKFTWIDFQKLNSNYFKDNSLVFANLPYLDINKKTLFETNCPTLKAEPQQALYTGAKGLRLYQNLFKLCQDQPLYIICECLQDQQSDLEQLAKQAGFKLIRTHNLASLFASRQLQLEN